MNSIDMLGCYQHQSALSEQLDVLSELSAVAVVFVDLLKVEAELRAYFLSHAFLEIFQLTWIFQISVGAINNSPSFSPREIFLEKAGVGSFEGCLIVSVSGVSLDIFAVGVGGQVINIDGLALVGLSKVLVA